MLTDSTISRSYEAHCSLRHHEHSCIFGVSHALGKNIRVCVTT